MGIKEVLQKYGERRRKLKEYEDELRIRKTAEERMKSSQERDLEDFYEKERQKKIKEKLIDFKRKEVKSFWDSPYKQKLSQQKDGMSMQSNFLGKGVYLR